MVVPVHVDLSGKVEFGKHPPPALAVDVVVNIEMLAAPGVLVVATVTFEFKVLWDVPPQLKVKSPRSSELNNDVL